MTGTSKCEIELALAERQLIADGLTDGDATAVRNLCHMPRRLDTHRNSKWHCKATCADVDLYSNADSGNELLQRGEFSLEDALILVKPLVVLLRAFVKNGHRVHRQTANSRRWVRAHLSRNDRHRCTSRLTRLDEDSPSADP